MSAGSIFLILVIIIVIGAAATTAWYFLVKVPQDKAAATAAAKLASQEETSKPSTSEETSSTAPAPAPAAATPPTFSGKAISGGVDSASPSATDYLARMNQGDMLDWWQNPSSTSATKFSLDSQGRLSCDSDPSGLYLCYNGVGNTSDITLSSTLSPIVFSLTSQNTLKDANGNFLGKGPNGQGSGSWPFILNPSQIVPPYVAAVVIM